MPQDNMVVQPLQVKSVGGQVVVAVPWREAEALQTHLRRHSVPSTLHLEPSEQEARLEIWPGPDAAAVQAALDLWPE
jgi:hypothetical protein